MATIIYNASDVETVQPQEAGREIPAEVRMAVPFAGWMDRHPVLTNVIIGLGVLALFWVILTYDFTTRI